MTNVQKYKKWLSGNDEFDSAAYKADVKAEYINTMAEASADRAEDIIRHAEPQNDMNGFTIKIYYDYTFFDLVNFQVQFLLLLMLDIFLHNPVSFL